MSELFKRAVLATFLVAWVGYCLLFWSKGLFVDAGGNLVAGHVNIWGDWAAHMTMGNAMAARGPLLNTSPLLIGQPFAYPFVSNMVSALLIKAGLPLIPSYTVPSFIFSCLLVVALFWFYRVLFKSRGVALVATVIFLLNGGMGFYYFAQDVMNSTKPKFTLLNPPHEYTRLDEKKIKWISVIDSMVIPQRAFTLGFPLALVALGLVYQSTFETKKKNLPFKKLLAAAALIGFLPLIHTHSFLATFVILACWATTDFLVTWFKTKQLKQLRQPLLKWTVIAGLVTIIALPLIWLFLSKNVSQGFIKWYPGWLARDFKENWAVFWFKNWSVTPFLAVISWAILFQREQLKKNIFPILFVPFFALFLAANLWLFQPFVWDNTKLIVWASVGFSGLVALWLYRSWQYAQQEHLTPFGKKVVKLILLSLFVLMTASGALDAYYIVRHDLHSHVMFSKEEVELASWAKATTPTESIWLTGDQHNHWLFVLTGRQALMTYRGWLWTHGYNYRSVESAVSLMYTNPEQSNHLFEQYRVNYIVVGPNERNVWRANEAALKRLFPVVKQTQFYTVFATQQPQN
jgi:hypothetical protein